MVEHKHHKKERTFVIVKPDGIQRSLVGEIIQRYERIGLKLIGLKIVIPKSEEIQKQYTIDPQWMKETGEKSIANYKKKGLKPPSENPIEIAKIVLKNLKRYMTSGPVVLMVWEGAHAVAIVRKITGATEPLTSDIGTIRGDFVLDSYEMSDTDGRAVRNVLHASGSVEEAEKEIALWFKDSELINYRLVQEAILYDVDLNGILE
ncbi:MAG: nucleoside-diphosphate kinase [Candidatus Pacebacteria bacterium]|jgi:nucleoside-diphosphate kinase|nr:nucleoside-diphosphate kinase [Candidatus Paceibacterota bacterium]|tara:strand:+ start:15673 stop:16287 length:615 start_codon:yes stop_codon:yes gene_type:complete